ncbi:MAG: RluA family pseudouridine synthase [Actinobacteria bacterium]|nr:RluA family pseudouridine synthase [Actinomycetota bacterium]
MTKRIELTVSEHGAGQRLDAFLGADPRIGSRSSAGRLVERGRVEVDGHPAKKSQTLSAGQRVTVETDATPGATDPCEPAVPFRVAYEDDDLLVVDKPAGLVVHPAPGNPTGTLAQALRDRAAGGSAERPGIVHRLDKLTSGLLVVAKSDLVLRKLQEALQRREVKREYLALVSGRPQSQSGTIDAPLGRDRRAPEQVAVRADSDREAVTHFEVAEELPHHTLLTVRLETGRTHQIRAHLAAIGLPVSGDETYGVSGDLGLDRQFLHAAVLEFVHPVSGAPISVESRLPEDLSAALERARATN